MWLKVETPINPKNQKDLVVKKSMKQLSLLKFIEKDYVEVNYQTELRNLIKDLKVLYYKLVEIYQNNQIENLPIIIRELEDIIESYSYL